MASRKTSIAVVITGDARDLMRSFGQAENAAQKMGRKLNDIGNKLTLGVTLPIVAMGAKAVSAASDLEEALDKTDAIFGSSAGVVKQWSETSAEAMGLASAAALDAAGNLGNMLQSAGVSSNEAANLSMSLVQLAADMGSLNNVDPGEMLIKLQAGLAGEAEPLRRFGVDLNAAAVEAKALELGLVGVGEELSQQDKLMARYAIIMEQTGTAQGNFAETSDSVANQLRTLRAEIENTAAELGTKLLPAVKEALGGILDLIDGFNNLEDSSKNALLVLAAGAAASGPLAKFAGMVAGVAGAVGGLVTALGSLAAILPFVAAESGVASEANLELANTTGSLIDAQAGAAAGAQGFVLAQLDAKNMADDLRASLNESIPTIDSWRTKAQKAADTTNQWPEPLMAAAASLLEVEEAAGQAAISILATGEAMLDAVNPVRQMRQANNELEQALENLRDVQGDAEASTSDLEEAQLDLIEAMAQARIASANASASFDVEGFYEAGRAVGFTDQEIRNLLASINMLDGAIVDISTSGRTRINIDTATQGRGGRDIAAFDSGGIVPGPIGSPQLIMAHGGETVLPTHKTGGYAGATIHIHNPTTNDLNADISKAMTAVRLLGVV